MNTNTTPQTMEAMEAMEQELLTRALNALLRTTGIDAQIVRYQPRGEKIHRPDAVIKFKTGEQTNQYYVEIKNVDRLATLGHIKNQLEHHDAPGIFVANRVTHTIAQACREADLQFIDAAGNAFLHGAGYLIFVTGQQPPADEVAITPKQGRAGTATALRMMFTILCQPELLNAPYREIKNAAGIALGAVGWVFFDLTQRGLMTGGEHKHARQFLERKRIINEWVTNFPLKLRPKLHPVKFRVPTPDWWKNVDVTKYNAQWGGEVAADKLTGYLKPATFTLYLHLEDGHRELTRLIADHRLRPDPNGDIEVLDAFWQLPPDQTHPDVVPPLLAYADLLATLDPRNLEVARMIYDRELFEGR